MDGVFARGTLRKSEDGMNDKHATLYESLRNDGDKRVAAKHFSVEGQLELCALLLVHRRAHFDLFESRETRSDIKLCVCRGFSRV